MSLDNVKGPGRKPDSFFTGLSAGTPYLGDVIDNAGENRGSDHTCLWIIVKREAVNQYPFVTVCLRYQTVKPTLICFFYINSTLPSPLAASFTGTILLYLKKTICLRHLYTKKRLYSLKIFVLTSDVYGFSFRRRLYI